MAQDFETWFSWFMHDEDELEGLDMGGHPPGEIPRGLRGVLAELFTTRGAMTRAAADAALVEVEIRLARQAADLVSRDVAATTSLEVHFDVRFDADLHTVVVSFHGNYLTPALLSFAPPESIAEVADNLQDHIVEEVWSAWPVCPVHDVGVYAQVVGGEAVWFCRKRSHRVARIGELWPALH